MLKKEEVVLVSSPVTYLRYTLAHDNVTAFEHSYTLHEDIVEMERIHSLSISLFNSQFAVDTDLSAAFVAPSLVGKYVRFVYYTEGELNPFYASSNLHKFIEQVLKWTSNRIAEGLYLHWKACDPAYMRIINEGSFVYENRFIVYPGGKFDIRQHAPPTVKGTYKAYHMFVNQEIIDGYLDRQSQLLRQIGILSSSTQHSSIDAAKLDVMTKYTSMYKSSALTVCYVYIRLNQDFSYDIRIEYPTASRTLA